MTIPSERISYRASVPLVDAPCMDVTMDGGRALARVERGRTSDGRRAWHWIGGSVAPFAVEDEGGLESFLVTRSDAAPFGRIRVRGWLRRRLEAVDSRGVRFVAQPDGRLCAPDGRQIGAIHLVGPGEVVAELERMEDPTLRTLALATPVCKALSAAVLLA